MSVSRFFMRGVTLEVSRDLGGLDSSSVGGFTLNDCFRWPAWLVCNTILSGSFAKVVEGAGQMCRLANVLSVSVVARVRLPFGK